MTIRNRLLISTLAFLIALAAIFMGVAVRNLHEAGATEVAEYRREAMEHEIALLREQVETAMSILKPYADSGSSEEVKARARDVVGRIRFGKSGYIYSYDYDGICQVLTTKRPWMGTPRIGEKDKKDRFYVKDLIEAAKRGGDTVRYSFDRPGSSVIADKIGYARGFEPWKWMVGSGAYIDDIDSIAAVKRAEIQSRNRSMIWKLVLALLAVVALVAPTMAWILGKVFSPVKILRDRMRDVGGGEADLRQRLEVVRMDEVGEVSHFFNLFLEVLEATVRDVMQATQRIATGTRDLAGMSGEISQESDVMSRESSQVAAKVSHAAATMEGVSDSADSANRSVSTLAAAIEEMNASLGEVARTGQQELQCASRARERTVAARKRMAHLDQVVEGVGGILEAVEKIAGQTKLLALNATIEAARAGEAGKGFGVVAGEVKDLAQQTAKATSEIRVKIQEIRQGGRDSSDAFGEVETVIDEVHQLSQVVGSAVEEQSATIAEIAKTVSLVDREVGSIATSVKRASEDLKASALDLDKVDRGNQRLKSGLERVDAVVQEQAKQASSLDAAVGRFRT